MHYRLNVPYQEKDEAKAYGARWNAMGRYWYFDGELPEGLKRWYPEAVPSKEPAVSEDKGRLPELFSDFDAYKTVTQVNDMIQNRFRTTAEFQFIMVKGEVTDFDGHKGRNYYFSIKDKESLLPCFLWEDTARSALGFELKAGQQVAITGSLELYRARAKSQLVVRSIINIGEGEASLEYLKLKARLEAEGLFDEEHKKPIPRHPRVIGIVTSKDGQAIKDIQKVAAKRNPYVQLLLYHVNVQGVNAVRTIVEGIRALDALRPDTIIVGRGGGSDEELIVYNDERIARAVYAARTPIVSAVGHEGHRPLIDLVADKRAATPTEAAEETVPDVMSDLRQIAQLKENLETLMRGQLERRHLQLDARRSRLETFNPLRLLKERRERLEALKGDLDRSMGRAVDLRKHRLEVLLANLHGLSPTAKLVRGFGYITVNEKPVASVREVDEGDRIDIRIHDGRIGAVVTERTIHQEGEEQE